MIIRTQAESSWVKGLTWAFFFFFNDSCSFLLGTLPSHLHPPPPTSELVWEGRVKREEWGFYNMFSLHWKIIGLWCRIYNLPQPSRKKLLCLDLLGGLGGMLSVAGEVTGALQTWKESESCFPSGNLAPGNCLLCFYELEGWMLVAWFHRRPGSNRGLQTSTGWIIIHPWRQLQRGVGGSQPGGGASSQGSLTFQETGPALSHPPSSSNWWHNKGWMGQETCSTSSTLKLCVHEQNAAAKGLQIEKSGVAVKEYSLQGG